MDKGSTTQFNLPPSDCIRHFNFVSVADGSTRRAFGFTWRGIQYKVNVSDNQVDTFKDAIRLKKGVTLCFPKGGMRGDHVLLLTPARISRLDNAHVGGSRAQIRMSA